MDKTLVLLRDDFAANLAALDAYRTQATPADRPNAWTVQQIVEHLMMSYARTEQAMHARLEKGTPTKARATLKLRAAQFAVCKLQAFPKGHIAPEMVQPGPTLIALNGRELCDKFAAALDAMDARLNAVSETFGHGRSVSHVVLGPMTIEQWRRFHLSHGRHHLKQIKTILRSR